MLAYKSYPSIIQQVPKQTPDLIDDGTWREAALARMNEAFPTNWGLWPMYRLMAGAHRYAIDYIEQVPVIVRSAAHGNAHVSWSERAFIQEQLRKVCESKAQLRDVMRSYGLPLPLRLFDARVLTARRATVIRRWRMPGWIFTHNASRGSWLLDDPETRARWDAEHQTLRFTKKGPLE